ncbi:MAG: hypothetical protein OXH96_13335 [Spirochaetaceae bacterium]|nr:hypothetical protein [Spirochaetaceae bacterium]
MKVRVDRIRDPGVLDQERLVLRVLATTDIGDYALLRTRYDAETVLAGNCDAFWFPFRPVYKDDLVVVYTKPGVMKEKLLEDGAKAHFFYWGLEYPIWNADDRGAVILYAPTWKDNHQQHLMRPRSASATT